jgi:hypothetical protein
MAERRRSYRACAECGAVRLSAEFRTVPITERPQTAPGLRARCPACEHIAPRWVFRKTAPPVGGEGAGGTLRPSPEPQAEPQL